MQVVAASHSEVILNEAADRDVVVAFLDQPHRIDDRGSQLLKAFKEIGFGQYYQAEQIGWVLHLEGSTDLAIWRAFAESLEHPAQRALERPFVHYTANQSQHARDHFNGLREACADLVGFALFDRLDRPVLEGRPLREWMWARREIENYLCQPATLLGVARQSGSDDALGRCGRRRKLSAGRRSWARAFATSCPPPRCETPPTAGGSIPRPATPSWTASSPASSANWAFPT